MWLSVPCRLPRGHTGGRLVTVLPWAPLSTLPSECPSLSPGVWSVWLSPRPSPVCPGVWSVWLSPRVSASAVRSLPAGPPVPPAGLSRLVHHLRAGGPGEQPGQPAGVRGAGALQRPPVPALHAAHDHHQRRPGDVISTGALKSPRNVSQIPAGW